MQRCMLVALFLNRKKSIFQYNNGLSPPLSLPLLVNSTTCQYGSIRLSNGTPHMGRLEVCLGGTFGSVCDENWSTAGASVVCRQLGLSSQGGQEAGLGL